VTFNWQPDAELIVVRVVGVMEELAKLLTRDVASLTDRHSERKEEAADLSKRVTSQ
jgi:hypothetical protein